MKSFSLTIAICLVGFVLDARTSSYGYDLLYPGPYEVTLVDQTDTLNCRHGPSTRSKIQMQLPSGEQIVAKEIEYNTQGKPWFYTEHHCYVRASSAYLVWRGLGEDPSTMCDPRTESC